MLLARGQHAQHQILRDAYLLYPGNFVAKLSRRAFLGQQGAKRRLQITGRQGLLQLRTLGRKRRGTRAAQCHSGITQGLAVKAVAAQQLFGLVKATELSELHGEVQD